MRRLNYGPAALRKRKGLSESIRALIESIDSEYFHLRKMLVEGRADPAPVRTALRGIEIVLREDVGLLKNQRRYLLKALSLSSEVASLDHAFGIARRKRGAPEKTSGEQATIAAEVLRLMLKGRSLEKAAIDVGSKLQLGATQARHYWASNKLSAIALVRLERGSNEPWSKAEIKRLRRLLARDGTRLREFFEQEDGTIFPPSPDAPAKYLK
jgi:hypothetical protein